MIVWGGEVEIIQVDYAGTEILLELSQQRRGAILLGSHFGSWELLRSVAERTGVTLNVLVFAANAPHINAFFERLHPDLKLRMIPLEPGTIRSAFEMKAAIDRGEFVGVMGDRLWEAEGDRSVSVKFLGRPARFPLGPFMLQAVLGCPMILTGCFRTGAGCVSGRRDSVRAGGSRAARRAARVRRGAGAALCDRARGVVRAQPVPVVQLLRVLVRGGRSLRNPPARDRRCSPAPAC